MARWEIYVCDALLQRQGQLDDYERLQAHTRHRNTGTWTLDLDGRSSSVAQLRRPGWGIDVVRDGASVFAGPARKVGRKRTATANQVTVAGWDDMVWLARRLAHPQPGTAAPPYSTTEYDIRTGTASTVIRAYVNVNAGPGAVEARRVPGLVLGADPLTGASISGEARWVNLLGFLRGLAVVGGDLGFRVARPDGGGLRFDVSAPRDLADDIKLSTDLGTLAEYGYETGEPTATWWVVGGGGEGAARTIREGGDQAAISSGYGRIESFVDRRDTTDSTALAQEIARQQAESAEASAVSITPIDISRMTYLDDYQLGDQVTTVVDDTVIVDVIREAELSLTPTEVRVTPKLGTEAKVDTTGIRIYRHMRALESRVAQLKQGGDPVAVSADTYAPFSSGAGSDVAEDTWRKFMRRPTVSGVLRNIGSELQVYADSSGRQVKVRAGEVWIEGHWGEWLAESILPVAENASGLLRKDRVVARADFGEDVVELDVVQGTAGAGFAPTVTRNTSLYEVSLGTVDVAAGTTSLAAGTVLDARTYGGPVYPTGSDDKTFFGDKLSSIPRADVVVANSITNGFTYLSRISTAVEAVVSKLRLYVDVAQIAGTFAAKVYKGYNQRDLQEIAAPVMTATSIGVREGTFTPVLIEAGMQVVVAVTATGASTTAQLGSSAVVLGTTLLNTSGSIVTTAFKNTGGAALPSTLDLLDGSWSLRDRVPWVALA